MHAIWFLSILAALLRTTVAQQVFDIWQTLHDKSSLFAPVNLAQPLNFTPSSSTADITIDETTSYQTLKGFGASLTDSGAQSLTTFDASSAGITYLRVPLGASDFSHTSYSYDDTPGDSSLAISNRRRAKLLLKVHVVPWSPPGWMKASKTMNGGNFTSSMAKTYAQYLLKALQGFESKGVHVSAISIQNEPLNSNPTLPSCKMTYQDEGAIGSELRPLMKNNSFPAVKLIGFEHNWSSYQYPISLMKSFPGIFDGVAFHCYGGSVDKQDQFVQAVPNKDVYFTECTGMDGSDWWDDIKYQTEHIFMGTIEHHAQTALMWRLISGEELPGSTSCYKDKLANQCRAAVDINDDGTYTLNQEYYAIAHAAHAVLPAMRGRSTLATGDRTANLRVNAYATPRVSANDPTRYALHVLNMGDDSGPFTVAFRGKQLSYSFPVGVSTFSFYA
ncbi:glycoside hydrolase family 30 protein [Mycena leptocephala]|nr:glycoside hydrolase family 30 protein [Mycena leptocephala]